MDLRIISRSFGQYRHWNDASVNCGGFTNEWIYTKEEEKKLTHTHKKNLKEDEKGEKNTYNKNEKKQQ